MNLSISKVKLSTCTLLCVTLDSLRNNKQHTSDIPGKLQSVDHRDESFLRLLIALFACSRAQLRNLGLRKHKTAVTMSSSNCFQLVVVVVVVVAVEENRL